MPTPLIIAQTGGRWVAFAIDRTFLFQGASEAEQFLGVQQLAAVMRSGNTADIITCIGNVLDFQGAVDAQGVFLTMYSATDSLIYISTQIFAATAAGVDTLLECLAQAGAALCAACV